MPQAVAHSLIIAMFCIGYLAIIFEFLIKINKTAVGIAVAGILWLLYFLSDQHPLDLDLSNLSHHLSDISQIIFFLLGAMTLVELIDSHKGFNTVIRLIHTHSKRSTLVIVSFLTFFLSSVLDNLTTTILMISILRKLVPFRKERLLMLCMVVIAANAGGAWTPIGDVTTTMLWINGRISTSNVMWYVFLPSMVSMLIPMGTYLFFLRGKFPDPTVNYAAEQTEPGGRLVFFLGLLSLISVPIIKWLTGLPPFMGILMALAVLWLVTDILHYRYEERKHLRIPYIFTKIEVSSILFFLGILLCVGALESVGILKSLAFWMDTNLKSPDLIAIVIGGISAVIDNVPLVGAAMGMYDLTTYGLDNSFWLFVAYTAGVGGSMLSIGSAAGVAVMGIEKVDFFTYAKIATIPAAIGYLAGALLYIWL